MEFVGRAARWLGMACSCAPLLVDVDRKTLLIFQQRRQTSWPTSRRPAKKSSGLSTTASRTAYRGRSSVRPGVHLHRLHAADRAGGPPRQDRRPDRDRRRLDVEEARPNNPSPLLIGNELFLIADRGVATMVDAKTGEQIYQERVGGNFSASPLLADGRIYLLDEDGKCAVIATGKESKVARERRRQPALASLSVAASRSSSDEHTCTASNSSGKARLISKSYHRRRFGFKSYGSSLT